MKVYDLIEAIEYLETNPDGEFELEEDKNTKLENFNGKLSCTNNGWSNGMEFDSRWLLVRKPSDFMTVLRRGYPFEVEISGVDKEFRNVRDFFEYITGYGLMGIREIIEGDFYLKE